MQTHRTAERSTQFKLDAHERPKFIYEYWVTGDGEFPFDMLRFDNCWPVSGEDAARMIHRHMRGARRSLKMRSYTMPTADRWSSFGWSVGPKAAMPEPARQASRWAMHPEFQLNASIVGQNTGWCSADTLQRAAEAASRVFEEAGFTNKLYAPWLAEHTRLRNYSIAHQPKRTFQATAEYEVVMKAWSEAERVVKDTCPRDWTGSYSLAISPIHRMESTS